MQYKILIAAILVATPAQAQTLTLRGADSLWAKNYAVNDTASALKLMAADFAMTASNGRFKTRAQELGDVRATPGLTLHYFRTRDVTAEEVGTTGLVAGTAEWSYTLNGRASNTVRHYNAVYRKGGDLGWELVALYMRTAPGSSSLASLKWIEGTWRGTGEGTDPFYERYRLQDDTTLVIESFGDSTLTRVTDTTTYASRRGFVTNLGSNQWVAQTITPDSIVFIPLRGVRNSFVWRKDPAGDGWFAIIKPLSGASRTYTMRRR